MMVNKVLAAVNVREHCDSLSLLGFTNVEEVSRHKIEVLCIPIELLVKVRDTEAKVTSL